MIQQKPYGVGADRLGVNGGRTGYRCHWDILETASPVSAKTQYLSNIICNISHRPQVLFNTINSVINPVLFTFSDASKEANNAFLQHFIHKFAIVKQAIVTFSLLTPLITVIP